MSMRVKYSGKFVALGGAVYRVDILQESAKAFDVAELDVVGLEIQWPERELEEVICSSMATLTLNSPGDRTYVGLYTVKPGNIRMDVYRDDALYWSGALDPEFYGEPYSRGANYNVEFTFSDFGILDRKPYDLSGRQTLQSLLMTALSRSGIAYSRLNTSYISTKFTDGTDLTLSALSIPSENFFDEDGKASSYKEVVEGILQPLALRMIQRAGTVFIYDLNGIYTKVAALRAIDWNGDNAALSTSPVYNNIIVTFSPYAASRMLEELTYGDIYGPEWTNITQDKDGVKYNQGTVPADKTSPECYSFYLDYDPDHKHGSNWDYSYIGFTIFVSKDSGKCTGLASIGASNYFFKILPVYGGQESEGVVMGFRKNSHFAMSSSHMPRIEGLNPASHPKSVAMTTKRTYIPYLESDDQKNNFLRILMSMMCDVRYDPFEEASEDGNEGDSYDAYKSWANQAYLAADIVIYNEAGTALWHYRNKTMMQNGHPADSVIGCASTTKNGTTLVDGWFAGESSFGEAWLAWYNPDDLGDTGILGWKENRQNFGKPWREGKASKRNFYYYDQNGDKKSWWMFDSFKRAPSGQFIPYPPAGGYLEIRIYNGVYIYDDVDKFSQDVTGTAFYKEGLYDKLRWVLFQVPEVTVVRRTLTFDEVEMDDVEYSGVASVDAKEDLPIDTICGTASGPSPTARGIYLRASTGAQIQDLTRAGRTGHPEQLLIGTIYSQYAERKVSLKGDATIDPGPLALYKDDAQENGVRLLIKGETQDVLANNTEATFVEIRPDEYTGKTS